ncbi:D-alanyl-D-alanine carboxypeptidase family protein [Aerococcaceae bacterium WGS1372]
MRLLVRILILFMVVGNYIPKVTFAAGTIPTIDAPTAMAIDSENGLILFEKNSDQVYEVGSISKLLTAYVSMKIVQEREDLDESSIVPISDQAYNLSQNYEIGNVPLRQDYNYSVNELVESIAINSATGSALALAEFVAGSEEEFVQEMETQLEEWGLEDYELVNATGLRKDGDSGSMNAFSAEVAAVIAYHLVNDFPQFVTYGQEVESVFKPNTDDPIEMNNNNQMLSDKPYFYEGVLGLMPGSSSEDGTGFVSYANIDTFGVITVVLGSKDEESRYEETIQLLDYSYRAYMKELVLEAGQEVTQTGRITVQGSNTNVADLVYGEDLFLVVPIVDTAPRLEYHFQPNQKIFKGDPFLQAPIEEQEEIGVMSVNSVGVEQVFLPSTKGNIAPMVLRTPLEEATWYVKGWQSFSEGVGDSWESMRQFFVELFN